MAKFTFLEIHLDNADIDGTAEATADALTALPFSSVTTGDNDDVDDAESTEIEIDTEDEETTVSLAPLFLLAGLVVLAIVLKKRLSGDDE